MAATVTCSIVVPVFNEEEVLPVFHRRVTEVMTRARVSYELVLVDDGSSDSSLKVIKELRANDQHVAVLALSRNFGHQLAITAGVDHARGEAIVVMDSDLQDPPEVLLEMLSHWKDGYDVVYGKRTTRLGEGILKRATAKVFYRLIRALTNVDIPVDTGDFRLISRRVADELKNLRERNRFMRGMVAWVGYKQIGVKYQRAARAAGTTKYHLRKMVRFANDAILSFSFVPLRLATGFGLLVSISAFAYAVYAVYLKIGPNVTLPGWASLMVAIVFLGGVQLVCLGILGEYVGRVYDEVKARPLYLVAEYSPAAMEDGRARHESDRTSAA